jgi:hypothetical protein
MQNMFMGRSGENPRVERLYLETATSGEHSNGNAIDTVRSRERHQRSRISGFDSSRFLTNE